MSENKLFAYAQKSEMLDEEKSIVCYASTNEVDRHGEMILASAWTEEGLKNYRKNPVILVNHDYWSLPVAKSIWQKVDSNGLKFKICFADTDAGSEVYNLYKGGFMHSFSVGFRPIKTYDNSTSKKYKDRNGETPHTVYEECELLELSCVTIPANPSATVLSGMKSMVERLDRGEIKSAEVKSMVEGIKKSKEYIELVSESEPEEKAKVVGFVDLEGKGAAEDGAKEKIETTPEYHHIPVMDVADFVDDSFKTIDITDGVKAVVGKLKSDPDGSTHVQKYLFDVDAFTMEEARAWVEEHKAMDDEEMPHDGEEEMPCDGKGEECEGDKCPKYDSCGKPHKKSLQTEGTANQEDTSDNSQVETQVDEKQLVGLMEEIKNEIKEIRRYVDENIEEKLKFFQQNADKVNNEGGEKSVIDFEIKKQVVDVDFSPEDVKKMVKESISSAFQAKEMIDVVIEERLKRHKGIIF